MKKFLSKNKQATQKIAANLAVEILKESAHLKRARIIGLMGDLGAGKTTFMKSFAKMFHVKQKIVSPTFMIFRNYKIPAAAQSHFTNLYHVDLYRINSAAELNVLGFRDILKNPKNLVLIEWADKIRDSLPPHQKDPSVNARTNGKKTRSVIQESKDVKPWCGGLPKNTIWLLLEHGKNINERTIVINN